MLCCMYGVQIEQFVRCYTNGQQHDSANEVEMNPGTKLLLCHHCP